MTSQQGKGFYLGIYSLKILITYFNENWHSDKYISDIYNSCYYLIKVPL